jgi:lysozyme
LNINEEGLKLLKSKESYSAVWYLCPAKKMTIGWGHVKEQGDKFNVITPAQGQELLIKDCKKAIDCINSKVTYSLTENQFSALVVFVFNIGITAFSTSTLLKKLNAGLLDQAASQFDVWNKITVKGKKEVSNGLIFRRAQEKALFLKP